MNTQLITAKQLAARLGVSPLTIKHWRAKGNILPKVVKIGNCLRFREKDVEAWIADRLDQAA